MSSSTIPDRNLRSSSNSDTPVITNISELATYMKKLNSIQNKKIDEISSKIDDNTSQLNNKIDALCNEMNGKINTLSAEVNSSLNEIRKDVDKKIFQSESLAMSRLNDLERRACSCDLLVHGIPFLANENPTDIIKQVCLKIGLNENTGILSVFRIKPSITSSKISPIIVKCISIESKQRIFMKYITYKNLCLKDIGIDLNNRIFINDCLTKLDNIVMRNALELKKMGKIEKVGVRNGHVVVKVTAGSSFKKINAVDLEKLSNSS